MKRADFGSVVGARLCFAVLIMAGISLSPASVRAGGDTVHLTAPHQQIGTEQFVITTVSARNDLISGDSALVRVSVPAVLAVTQVGVYLNNIKVTSAFTETPVGTHALQGLVKSLRRGDNTLLVRDEHNKGNSSQLVLTNYAITGPILSGTHIKPYECRTTQNGLGSPLDADCSATAKVSYYYRSTTNSFKARCAVTVPARDTTPTTRGP